MNNDAILPGYLVTGADAQAIVNAKGLRHPCFMV